MKLTLARALRYKKRVVESIRKLENDIQQNNSRLVETEPEISVHSALTKREILVNHLTQLKLKLQEATRPIQKQIFDLAETKSRIAFLERLNVAHGKVPPCYREDFERVYVADVRKKDRDSFVVDLQKQIDSLLTQIDLHNTNTTIEIEEPVTPEI